MLPRNATSPVMDGEQMAAWLNQMAADGWEFVGHAQKHWVGSEPFIQDWWIFKRPALAKEGGKAKCSFCGKHGKKSGDTY